MLVNSSVIVLPDNLIDPTVSLTLLHPVTGVGAGVVATVGIAVGGTGVLDGVGGADKTSWGELPLLGLCLVASAGA